MSLLDAKNTFREAAAKLPKKYEEYSINELADGYCEALDSNNLMNQNIYISALVLRFWYVIGKMYEKCQNFGYEREDMLGKLYECIEAACHYRAWQDPAKNTNAQACINQVIAGRGVPALIYEANLLKNTKLNTTLDNPLDETGETTMGDTIADDNSSVFDGAKDLIQTLVKNNRIVEAIIADNIAYNDVFKHEKKTIKETEEDESGESHVIYRYTDHTSEFWPFKLVQTLNTLDDKYVNYFTNTYHIDADKFKPAYESITKATNSKKYKFIDAFLTSAKSYVSF